MTIATAITAQRARHRDGGWGAMTFMLMSMLAMIASIAFDPRLMWDAAEAASAPSSTGVPDERRVVQEAPA